MAESDPDLDEGGWIGTSPRTPEKLSWRNDPQESHSDWRVVLKSGGDEDDKIYHLHKVLLSNGARASGYFHAQFSQKMDTIESKTATTVLEVPRECAPCMPKLLDFIYEGTLKLEADTAVPMMELARRLDIPALGRECIDWIKATLKASDAQFAFKAFLQGHELCMEKVCAASVKVVARMFNTIDTDSLTSLPIDRLVQLLQLDDLNADEDQVFALIVACKDSRKLSEDDIRKLWLCCRFSQLSSRKKVAALQQDTFPREVFFEDAVACIALNDEAFDGSKCFTSECNRRTKERRIGSHLLKEGSELTAEGNYLTASGGACFQVLPESPPDAPSSGQHTNFFQIPEGWEVVNTSDADFKLIRSLVIAQYAWGTDVIHIKTGEGSVGFHSKHYGRPGAVYNSGGSFLSCVGNNFRFTGSSGRLLVRKKL